jgi:hypothetical protein
MGRTLSFQPYAMHRLRTPRLFCGDTRTFDDTIRVTKSPGSMIMNHESEKAEGAIRVAGGR